MTIKLLATYQQYKPGTIVTLDSAFEAYLIAQKNATADLTGGAAYVAPVVPNNYLPAVFELNPAGGLVGISVAGGRRGLVIDPAAPSNTDGRPDGTIYVQTA